MHLRGHGTALLTKLPPTLDPSHLQRECRSLMPTRIPRNAHLHFTAFASSCLLALRAATARNRRTSEHCTRKALSAGKGKEYPYFKCSCGLDSLSSKKIITMVWHTLGAYRTGAPVRHGGTEIAENTAGFASSAFKSSRKHSINLSLYIFQWI